MNYKNIYDKIIKNRLLQPISGYTEVHHIIPRSIGGTNDRTNLVELSAREHFICHYLLTKIHKPGTAHGNKMIKAFMMMLYCHSENQQRHTTSKYYEILRQQFSEIQRVSQIGENNSQHGTMWISNISLRQTKKIHKYDDVPDGWIVKRIINFDKYLLDQERQDTKRKPKLKKAKNEAKIIQHIEWYNIYKDFGFNEFKRITGYKYSKPNLVTAFARYVPDFEPQNGKKRYSPVAQ